MNRKEYMRKYYAEHKLEYSFRAALRYEQNKEAIKERVKAWQDNNKEKVVEYHKKHKKEALAYKHDWIDNNPLKYFAGTENYFDKNVESHREYASKYSKEHPECIKKSKKNWRENNKEYQRVLKETIGMVESGEIIKKPCSICGNVEVMAYHNDRIDPKNIDWLCKEHFWQKKKEFYRERKRIKLGLTSK